MLSSSWVVLVSKKNKVIWNEAPIDCWSSHSYVGEFDMLRQSLWKEVVEIDWQAESTAMSQKRFLWSVVPGSYNWKYTAPFSRLKSCCFLGRSASELFFVKQFIFCTASQYDLKRLNCVYFCSTCVDWSSFLTFQCSASKLDYYLNYSHRAANRSTICSSTASKSICNIHDLGMIWGESEKL